MWANATEFEFVSVCVCAGILYGEACDGDTARCDNASRDQDEQIRQMEQRTAQDEVNDVVPFEGAHVCRR